VSIYGLGGSDTPKTVKLDRIAAQTGAEFYGLVCGNCHGMDGNGGTAPSLIRETQLSDPEKLKAFLKSVPPPMPILYPGLLEEKDVDKIADHLKVLTGRRSEEAAIKINAAFAVRDSGAPTAQPEWQNIYSVLTSARCINCHTVTDYPRQGDDRHPHIFGVLRASDDKGMPVARCTACHGDTNNSESGIPGRPGWRMAPLPNAWESAPGVIMTPSELCRQITDPLRNGARDMAKLIEHVDTDHFVLWAWDPGTRWNGEARKTPPLSHEEFVNALKKWAAAGAACPAPTPGVMQASSKH
jgi:mono/diheme cytochrome c family protein